MSAPRNPLFDLAHSRRAVCAAVGIAALAMLGACASFPLPDKPVRPAVYDLGLLPAQTMSVAPPAKPLLPITMADTSASAALDSTSVWYRLAYDNAQQLRPYALARWSMPPAQLIDQRVHDTLAQQRTVLSALDPVNGAMQLRLDVQEFSQVFASASQSEGVLRLRATVTGDSPSRVIAQRSWVVTRPAPTPDAQGGVKALTAAVDSMAADLGAWLAGLR